MNSFNTTNCHDFRAKRKCFSITGCLIFVLLISHASCRPSKADSSPIYNDGDYTDVDDIEWENIPNAESTTKDHPIIFYKEDIVSEDYDPNNENKTSSKEVESERKFPSQDRRKYKEISHHNRHNRTDSNYRYLKPENVYFDIYPSEDVALKDEDTKFNDNDIRVEVISLSDDHGELSSDIKRVFGKTPKKFSRHHRHRRDLTDIGEAERHSLRHKRNYRNAYYQNHLPQYRGVLQKPQAFIFKHTIRTKYTNVPVPNNHGYRKPIPSPTIEPVTPSDVINRFGNDTGVPITTEQMPIWGVYPIPTTTPRPRSRIPPPPIIHSGDEDFVSHNRPNNFRTTTTAPRFPNSDFGISAAAPPDSGSWNSQFVPSAPSQRPMFQIPTTTPAHPPPSSNRQVSACIWAIISCCNADKNIRYQCFEREGCSGAFWDLNPCADEIHRTAVEASSQFFNK